MNTCPRPIGRRGFLKTGTAGGIAVAALPLTRLSSFTRKPGSPLDSGGNPSEQQQRRLREIVQKYGGEFGEVGREG